LHLSSGLKEAVKNLQVQACHNSFLNICLFRFYYLSKKL
jgi:hypothetical protein